MKNLKGFKIDNRPTRINVTDFKNWWTLQQLFAYPPFEEFFDTDKLIQYYEEFKYGGIYQLEVEVKETIWVPVGMMSWHPMVKGSHPVDFQAEKTAYISDAVTYRAYQKNGIQARLAEYTIDEIKKRGFEVVYFRTSPQSKMYSLGPKLGFSLIPDLTQEVESMRVESILKTDKRVFFYRKV